MKNQILNVKSLTFLFVSVLWFCGVSDHVYGDNCFPGDVIKPGESCEVRGPETGRFYVFRIGTAEYSEGDMRVTYHEKVLDPKMTASEQADGSWLIESIESVESTPMSSAGFCKVGDVIKPGENCRVPGTKFRSFGVRRDSAIYWDISGGIQVHNTFYGGIPDVKIIASRQADDTWLIEDVPGMVRTRILPTSRQMYWFQLKLVETPGIGVHSASWGHGLYRANLDGSNKQHVLEVGIHYTSDSAIDGIGGKIYWTNGESRSPGPGLFRVNLDGSNIEVVARSNDSIRRFELDTVGRKIYWIGSKAIRRSNLDGSNVESIYVHGRADPSGGLAVDGGSGKLYWIGSPFIESQEWKTGFYRSNLDGSNVEYIGPVRRELVVDEVHGKLYWLDAISREDELGRQFEKQGPWRIARSDLDGSNVKTLIGLSVPKGYLRDLAVDGAGGKIYWVKTTPRPNRTEIVYRANLDGSNVEEFITEDSYKSGITFSGSERVYPDLAVESFQTSDSTVAPGESFTFSGIVRNKGETEASPTTLRYYRSNNEAGTVGGKEEGEGDVPPLASDATSDTSVVLTAPTTPDTYYYRACVSSVSRERIFDNNCTPSIKVTVKPESDLAFKSYVTNIKTDDSTVAPGGNIRLAVIVTNRGKGEASPTTLRYYRSTDEVFTTDDTEVGKTDLSSLAVGSVKRNRVLVKAPAAPGVYYYGACIDSVDEERITDNNCTSAVKVIVKSKFELVIESLASSDSTLGTGESFRLSGIVRNRGEKKAPLTTLRYYRSTDEAFTAADTEVGKTDVPALASDATNDVSIALTAPVEPGVYYYGACVGSVGSNCAPAIKITVVREPKVLIAAAQRPPLYWIDTQAGTLHRLVGAKIEALVPNVQNATDLAVDIVNDRLYWAEKVDNRTGRIRAANLDGLNVKLVKDLTSVPVDIAVDTAGGKLYVINAWGKVQRMNLDGSKFEPNLITDLEMPNHLTLDVARGKIYWTEQTGEDTGEIRRANLDGSDVELVKALTSVPLGLAADVTQRKLYVASSADKIQQLSFDGSNFRPNFITDVESPQKVAVDAMGGKMYWTEMGKFRRANLDGSNVQDIVRGLEGLPTGITLGIAAVLPTPTPPPTVEPEVVIAEVERPPLYWIDTQAGTLHRLVGAEVENLAPSVQNAVSLAVDVEGGKLYWTEKTSDKTGRIRRADLDGSNVQLVKDLTSVPHGIALDGVGGKIYITNAWGKVQRLNVDGSNFEPNLITGLDMPKNLALDVSDSKVYWTEMSGRIRRANLDGSNVEDIATGLGTPMNLVVFDGTAYWTEQTGENLGEIRRVNLDGTNSERLLTLTSIPQGIAVDAMENKLYWTNADGAIQRVNLDGSDIEELVTGLVSPGDLILQIAAPLPPPVVVEERVSTDVNEDGVVNIQDLVRVASSFGQTGENAADVNADGIVNIQDLVLVAGAFGSGAAAAPVLHIQTIEGFTASEVQHLLSQAREMSLTDPAYLRGIAVLEQLLALLVPKETSLLPNYPNPFNPETWIPYQLAKPTDVTFHIYAANGALVRTLALGHQSVGIYQNRRRAVYWDGRNESGEKVASGIYFYTLSADDFTATRKMLIMK